MFEVFRAQAASALHLPQDVVQGEPVITVAGRQKVYIENYSRIASFHEEEIRLQARTCRIVVSGKRLRIEYYTKDDMMIAGQIGSVRMET